MIRYVSVFLEASSGTHTFSRLPFNLEFCGVYCNFAKKDTDLKKKQNQSSYSSNCWAGKVAKSSLPLKVLGGVRLSENINKLRKIRSITLCALYPQCSVICFVLEQK